MKTTLETRHRIRETAILEAERKRFDKNMSPVERAIFVASGAALVGYALRRQTLPAGLLGVLGAFTAAQGVLGHSVLHRALGIDTAGWTYPSTTRPEVLRGVNVVSSIAIDRSAPEVFAFWQRYDTFPHFMDHVKSIVQTGERTSRWEVTGPFGSDVEWDAEIVKEEKDQLIEWRAFKGDVIHAGSVRFEPVNGGRRTKVTVTIRWTPPAGIFGWALAKLLGDDPETLVHQDLRRFKQVLEAGEVPTTEGQPSGRKAA